MYKEMQNGVDNMRDSLMTTRESLYCLPMECASWLTFNLGYLGGDYRDERSQVYPSASQIIPSALATGNNATEIGDLGMPLLSDLAQHPGWWKSSTSFL